MLEVESEWDGVIANAGGYRVDQIVGKPAPFDNADYLLPADQTFVELKCLDSNKMHEEATIEKASALYLEELRAGRAPSIVFGTVEMTTAGFSAELTHNIMSMYRKAIQGIVKKANDQIKATKAALALPTHKGLLIVANNNHSALDPSHAHFLLTNILQQESMYRSINCAVFVSANQGVMDLTEQREVAIWIEIRRPTIAAPQQDLLDRLRKGWIGRLTAARGEPASWAHSISEHELVQLQNIKR